MADAPENARTAATYYSKLGVNSNTNDNSGTQLDPGPAWLCTITRMGKETVSNLSKESQFPKVPDELRNRRINPQNYCYDPLKVSIGPYHYKYLDQLEFPTNLHEMDKFKLRMVNQFVQDSGTPIGELYKKVAEIASTKKQCYSAASVASVSDEKFAQIMFVDGCFVLQFILCVTYDNKLGRSDQDIAFLRRDLLLLENQLPYKVLESLMNSSKNIEEHRFHKYGLNWDHLIEAFIETRWPVFARSRSDILRLIFARICRIFRQKDEGFQSSNAKEKKAHVHLLGRLYEQLVNKIAKDVDNNDFTYFDGQHLYYSAKDLKKVGISFKPSSSSALTDVEFKSHFLSGTLRLPPITIDMSTESMLLNLVAYETCARGPTEQWITAYICFMDSLINDEEDVVQLRSSGIIYNYLGTDQDVADLFNEMAKDLVPNPNAYWTVKSMIDKQSRSSIKKWVAECKHVYFRSPWSLIATIAAAFVITLTTIQTYLAAFPA